MARRATVIKQERKKQEPLLVLDAGDSLVGDRDPARKTQGQTSVAVMNELGYDAMVLGPKDLSLGLAVLRQRIAEAQFPVLSANAVVSATGELVADPYVLRRFHDRTIAIVGLSGGQDTEEIAIEDALLTAKDVLVEVAPQADVILLLSHAGALVDRQIAESVPGIDLIISGGKFQLDPQPSGASSVAPWRAADSGTLVLHADEASPGHAGRRMGVARLSFDDQGRLIEHDWRRLTLGPEIEGDPAMTEWVRAKRQP